MHDDIPEALRQTPTAPSSASKPSIIPRLLGVLSLAVLTSLVGIAGRWLWFQVSPIGVELSPTNSTSPAPLSAASPPAITASPEILLGDVSHLSYQEAPVADLASITADDQVKLRTAAAAAFRRMSAAAAEAGVALVPLSGFRSIQDQNYLFFRVKEEREQQTTERAAVSAPPGYSEHHTGYALDIGDGHSADTHLKPSFDQTAAFQWLSQNATRYSFELSFPPNNVQGVSYEPWHWRFVGDQHSLETFYRAHNLSPRSQP